jgi:hypothetical protein
MPLQIRRGPTANLPATPAEGEPLFNTTTSELLIGTGSGSVAMAKKVHTHPVGDIATTGGTASASTFLRGDGTWATPAGGGGASTPSGITFANPGKVLGSPQSGTTGTELSLTSQLSITGSNLDVVVAASGGLEKVSGLKIATGGVAEAMLASNAVTYAKIQNVSATDKLLGRSTAGSGSVEEITCTSAGRALLDDADAAAQRTTLGLGTIATQAASSVTITGGSLEGVTVTTGTYSSNVNEAIMHAVRKASGGTINKGEVIRITGSIGTHLLVELADADVEATSSGTIGIAATTITNSTTGYMMVAGELTGLSNVPTGSFANGDALWLSTTTGGFATTRPPQPAHGVFLGWVVEASNGSAGRIYVKVINYSELNELHDVLINGVGDNHFLVYDNATSLWKNESPSTARTSLGLGTAATSNTGDFAAASHTHAAGDITSGTLDIARIPTGTTSSTVSLGNHTHAASAITSGTLDIARIPRPGVLVPSTMSMTWSDFTGSSVVPWTSLTSGTSATVTFTQSGADDNPGLLTFSTGTTTTGRAGVGSGNTDAFVFGTRPHVFSTAVLIVSNLSSAADRYSMEAGFMDSLTGAFTYGAYFSYTDNVSNANWQCTCSNGTSSTSVDSGITVATGTWYRLEIEVNAAGTSVVFKINGTQVANINGSIPTTTSNRLGIAVQQRKNGGTTGTTARSSRCDYLLHYSEVSR